MAKKKPTKQPIAADAFTPPDTITHPKQRAWLIAYARLGSYCRASVASGVGLTTSHDWRRGQPAFAAALIEAREWFTEEMEFEADRRARDGVRRLKFHLGEPIIDPATGEPYVEHEYSDNLLMFRLKALRPEVYRERHEVKINEQELNAEIEALLSRRGGNALYTNGNGNGHAEH